MTSQPTSLPATAQPASTKTGEGAPKCLRSSRLRIAGYVLASLLPIYWFILFVLTHVPIPQQLHQSDKVAHFTAYMVLSGLVSIFLGLRWGTSLAIPVVAILASALYGALDEYTQQFVNRSTDVVDWVADVLGASVGAVAYYAFMRVRDALK
jgi:VanZ family protein